MSLVPNQQQAMPPSRGRRSKGRGRGRGQGQRAAVGDAAQRVSKSAADGDEDKQSPSLAKASRGTSIVGSNVADRTPGRSRLAAARMRLPAELELLVPGKTGNDMSDSRFSVLNNGPPVGHVRPFKLAEPPVVANTGLAAYIPPDLDKVKGFFNNSVASGTWASLQSAYALDPHQPISSHNPLVVPFSRDRLADAAHRCQQELVDSPAPPSSKSTPTMALLDMSMPELVMTNCDIPLAVVPFSVGCVTIQDIARAAKARDTATLVGMLEPLLKRYHEEKEERVDVIDGRTDVYTQSDERLLEAVNNQLVHFLGERRAAYTWHKQANLSDVSRNKWSQQPLGCSFRVWVSDSFLGSLVTRDLANTPNSGDGKTIRRPRTIADKLRNIGNNVRDEAQTIFNTPIAQNVKMGCKEENRAIYENTALKKLLAAPSQGLERNLHTNVVGELVHALHVTLTRLKKKTLEELLKDEDPMILIRIADPNRPESARLDSQLAGLVWRNQPARIVDWLQKHVAAEEKKQQEPKPAAKGPKKPKSRSKLRSDAVAAKIADNKSDDATIQSILLYENTVEEAAHFKLPLSVVLDLLVKCDIVNQSSASAVDLTTNNSKQSTAPMYWAIYPMCNVAIQPDKDDTGVVTLSIHTHMRALVGV